MLMKFFGNWAIGCTTMKKTTLLKKRPLPRYPSHIVYMYCMYCIILINNNQGSKSPSTATAIVC